MITNANEAYNSGYARHLENPLREHDPESFHRLDREIDTMRAEGYEVTVGSTDELAYENPEKIQQIFQLLDARDQQIALKRRDIVAGRLGNLGLNPFKRAYRREKKIDSQLEVLRADLLYDDPSIRAMPWHEQRGRAAALLTITEAHRLQSSDTTDDETGYTTMSGPLDASVLDYQFPGRCGTVSGLHIRDALATTYEQYGKHDTRESYRKADKALDQLSTFIHSASTPGFIDIVRYCSDGLGIRSRKAEVARVLHDYARDSQHGGGQPLSDQLWMSFGCGTALPMLEVLREIRQYGDDCPRLLLVDQDPLALASAAILAQKMGLHDKIELHCERLFDSFGRPIDLNPVLRGRKIAVAEDSGLREYLPDRIYTKLTAATWQHLQAGGLMTTGNMNANRPQRGFLHGLMGWYPAVTMRTIADGFRLHEKAGIPRGMTRARVTQDGVYTLFFSQKR